MNVRNTALTGLLVSLLMMSSNTVSSAKLMHNNHKNKVVTSTQAQIETPELVAANEKINKTKQQLETARKQLDAAKALLHAAQADYKAAIAARKALALDTRAQGLADASGLKQLTQTEVPGSGSSSLQNLQVPSALKSDKQTGGGRIQQSDFSVEPTHLR